MSPEDRDEYLARIIDLYYLEQYIFDLLALTKSLIGEYEEKLEGLGLKEKGYLGRDLKEKLRSCTYEN